MIETETKIIDINIEKFKESMKAKGIEHSDRKLQRRWVFSLPSKNGENRFIRVRTNGDITTLTYKHRAGETMSNTEEIETEVKDFDKTKLIISKILGDGNYKENYRITYNYEGAEITIDEWPNIPPIIEVEAESEEKILRLIKELEIDGRVIGNVGIGKVYSIYKEQPPENTKVQP